MGLDVNLRAFFLKFKDFDVLVRCGLWWLI